jgi:hypothetical protein
MGILMYTEYEYIGNVFGKENCFKIMKLRAQRSVRMPAICMYIYALEMNTFTWRLKVIYTIAGFVCNFSNDLTSVSQSYTVFCEALVRLGTVHSLTMWAQRRCQHASTSWRVAVLGTVALTFM